MQIMYRSTRNAGLRATASQAVLQGLAPDGGLFIPEEIPHYEGSWESLAGQTYQETAMQIMSAFLTDYTQQELKQCIGESCRKTYDRAVPVTDNRDEEH